MSAQQPYEIIARISVLLSSSQSFRTWSTDNIICWRTTRKTLSGRTSWPTYRNGSVYITLGQWNRLAGFNGGKDLRKPPYLVVKVKVD